MKLTKRKTKWVKSRKPDLIRGTPLHYPASVAARYKGELRNLVKEMAEIARSEFEPVRSEFAMDASIASQSRITLNRIARRVEELFAARAVLMVRRMVSGVRKSSSKSLHSSLQELTGGLSLNTTSIAGTTDEVFKAIVDANVALIKSVPSQFIERLSGDVYRGISEGKGLADVYGAIRKYGAMSDRRVSLIAADQVKKAFSDANRSEMLRLGIKKAQWIHSGGGREPRKSHVDMDGKVFELDEGLYDKTEGRKVLPAELPNCRCTMRPVIDFGEVDANVA